MTRDRRFDTIYARPLPAPPALMPLAEMVARIERVRRIEWVAEQDRKLRIKRLALQAIGGAS